MAKINDAASYPNTTVATDDRVLGIDVSDTTPDANGQVVTFSFTNIATFLRSVAETLTNKTINLANNTLSGTTSQFNTALSDGDFVTTATSATLVAGHVATIDDDGTQSSGTYTPAAATGNFKTIVNGGAFTLAPPSPATGQAITLSVLIRNNASAGAITTTGFTVVKGDSFTTTDGHEFICHVDVFDVGGTEWSALTVVALQ